MEKLKVAFFAEMLIEDADGASRTMFQLLQRIPKQQFDFLFICGVGPQYIFGFECFCLPAFPLNANYKMAFPQLASDRLKKKLTQFKPDIVHIATPSLLGRFALNYATDNELPVISIYHTHFISYINYYLKHVPFLINFVKSGVVESQRKFYNRCNLIYIPSETIARELAANGVEHHRIKIWKRGIDRAQFTPQKKDSKFIQQLTGNQKPVILFASRLVWEKNLDTLFDIYDQIHARQLPYNFVIAGDGVAMEACESRMPDAIFTGKLDHTTLAVLYASSDLFLFTSVSETIGNVVLEAMASGLPCVIADGGGSSDFIQQGTNGFKCQPFIANDYVEKVIRVLEDKVLKEAFIKAGLLQSQLYNWETLADIYFNDLQKIGLPLEYA